jgi:hypothetical protein
MQNGNGKSTLVTPPHDPMVRLNDAARITLGVLARGMMMASPDIPPDIVLNVLSFQFGQIIGDALKGDPITLIKIRQACRAQFEDGLSKMPMKAESPKVPENIRG